MSNKFLSRFSGSEIDKILTSVNEKLSFNDIVDDYSGGGNQKVASAESVRKIHEWSKQFDDPEWLEELFMTIQGSDVFKSEDRTLLERLKRGFVGVFQDVVERQANIVALDLKGGEVSLLKNKSGVQSLEYYDIVKREWIGCKWTKDNKQSDQIELTGGSKVVYQFDRFNIKTVKLLVRSETANDICAVEITACVKGGNTYWSTSGYVGSNANLVKVNRMYMEGDTAKLEMSLASGSTTTVYKLAEF